jgi:hypothetical protein
MGNTFAASMLPFIPADSYLVINVNFSRLVNQKEIKTIFDEQFKVDDNSFDSFYKRAGIEPVKDINNIMVFMNGQEKACVMVNGTFDTKNILDIIKADSELLKKVTVSDINGLPLINNSTSSSGNALLLNKNTVAFGEVNLLEAIAKVKAGKAKSLIKNKDFADLVKRMNTKTSIWGGLLTSGSWGQKVKDNAMLHAMKGLKSAFFSLNYEKFFTFVFTGKVAKKEQLAAFENGLNNILDALRGWVASTPEMLKLLKNAQIQVDKKTMARLIVKVPAEEFKMALTKLKEKAKTESAKKK